MIGKSRHCIILLLALILIAGCAAPAATTVPTLSEKATVRPTRTPLPPKITPTLKAGRPTRPPLPTKTSQAAQPTLTQKPAQPTATTTQEQTGTFPLGRKFEGIFTRFLLCKGGKLWALTENGLEMLDPQTMTRTQFPVDNLQGGPWSASDWIWTYEYLADDTHTGGFLVGRDPKTGQIEKYLDMMQNLQWETFLFGMGNVGSEYWVTTDVMQAILIDKLNGKAVGTAELPGIPRIIVDDGANIWFAGDELFLMNNASQKFTTVLEEYVTGLDTDHWNMWVITIEGKLYKVDLATYSWEEYSLAPANAWAGCFDGESYWYVDVALEVVQELILP